MNHNYCVIMAGGSGTRLWPVSRAKCPKQFLALSNRKGSFLSDTFDRFAEFMPLENILVVTTERYKGLVAEQIPQLPSENLIVEPFSRNTAPCILYSAYTILKRDPEAVMAVSPADHLISGEEAFRKAVLAALDYAAREKALMTIGVKPTRPDTNYGYIQAMGGKGVCNAVDRIIKVKTFIEKPDADLAKVLVDSCEFFWNSGIFVWTARTIVAEMAKYLPEVYDLFEGWERVVGTPAEEEFFTRAYSECLNISIDYGVMEKTDNAWLYPASFGWADIGSWESLSDVWPGKDSDGNGVMADRTLMMDNEDNLIVSNHKGKLLAVRGLKDFVVVDTKDVLFICPKKDKCIKDFITGIGMPDYEKYK